MDNSNDWFVVYTNPRCEKKIFLQLEQKGFIVFLPLQTSIRVWSDRKKKVITPLIPSVVFVKNINVDKKKIYTQPGFISILKLNGKIACVKDFEIERLRLICNEELNIFSIEIKEFLFGEEVEIINGPFTGQYAKTIEEKNKFRVLVEIPTLGIGYCVDVSKNNVRKLASF